DKARDHARAAARDSTMAGECELERIKGTREESLAREISRQCTLARNELVPDPDMRMRILNECPLAPRALSRALYGYATDRRTLDRGHGPRAPRRPPPLRGHRRGACCDARPAIAAPMGRRRTLPAIERLPPRPTMRGCVEYPGG